MAAPKTGHMAQVRVTLSGFTGGPGVATFYADATGTPATPDVTHIAAFFAALTGIFPAGVVASFPSAGDILDPTNGQLVDAWSIGTAPAAVTMAGAGAMCTAQGAQIKWTTLDIADGRAIAGRTFIVPSAAGIFGSDGQLSTAIQTQIYTAGAQIIAANPQCVVWHRPKKGKAPAGGGPAPIDRTGAWSPIVGRQAPRKAVVLTSRRD
jgi:hypothetical protein